MTLASEKRYDLGDVLKTPGVSSKITGKAAELVKLFTDADELEAVSQGQKWAQDNSSYISNFGEFKSPLIRDAFLRASRKVDDADHAQVSPNSHLNQSSESYA